jgi:hypothetical protein
MFDGCQAQHRMVFRDSQAAGFGSSKCIAPPPMSDLGGAWALCRNS